MGKVPQFIYECPNVENTLPLEVFRAQSPARYSQGDGDKMVLYAGNSKCSLEIPASDNIQLHEKLRAVGSTVAVFVLDTSLVLWFLGSEDAHAFGVEMPYPSIVLHALKEVEGQSVLYLQVLSCDLFQSLGSSEYTQTVELMIKASGDVQNTGTPLLPPLLTDSAPVPRLYEALGACSALHYDSEPDSDAGEFGEGHEWITADLAEAPQIEMPASWVNSGDADDLEMAVSGEAELDGEAGMNVAVEYVTVAGVVRRRASVSEEASKSRKIG